MPRGKDIVSPRRRTFVSVINNNDACNHDDEAGGRAENLSLSSARGVARNDGDSIGH